MTTKLKYNGYEIAFDDDKKVNLTDMWKAVDGTRGNRPVLLLTQYEQGKNFLESLAKQLKVTKNDLWKSKRGRYGGTFANRQLSNFKQMVPVGYEHWGNAKEKQRRIIATGLDRLLCLTGLYEREIQESNAGAGTS